MTSDVDNNDSDPGFVYGELSLKREKPVVSVRMNVGEMMTKRDNDDDGDDDGGELSIPDLECEGSRTLEDGYRPR